MTYEIFLWIFGLGLLLYLLLSLVLIYHIVRFSYMNGRSTQMLLLHLLVSFVVLTGVWGYIRTVDWDESLEFGDIDAQELQFPSTRSRL